MLWKPDALRSRLEARHAGETIVLANGCFDILHAGHVGMLAEAKAQGDVLIVAMNSDASVRRLKGATRPIHTLADRAAVLAALRCVDYVTSFADDTPEELIEYLRPDVLVKGADWRGKKVAGMEWVERVHFVESREGLSTTRTIERLNDRQRCLSSSLLPRQFAAVTRLRSCTQRPPDQR